MIGEEDVSGTAIGTVLSAGIVDVFSDEVVNAAELGGAADPPERAIGRCWLAVTAAALVTGVYAAPVVIPATQALNISTLIEALFESSKNAGAEVKLES